MNGPILIHTSDRTLLLATGVQKQGKLIKAKIGDEWLAVTNLLSDSELEHLMINILKVWRADVMPFIDVGKELGKMPRSSTK